MTVDTKDLSNYDGMPIMLYDFYRVSTPTVTGVPVETHWRFTSADRDFTLDGNLYAATTISDDGFRQAGSTATDELAITVPRDNIVAQMFIGSPPSDPISCIIRHANEGETDAHIAWAGTVGGVTRTAPEDGGAGIGAVLRCATVSATLDRTGLRLAWSRACPHNLYGSECRANPLTLAIAGLATHVDGATVSVDNFATLTAPQTLLGGFIEWLDDYGHAERAGVISHSSTTVRVMGTLNKLTVGTLVYGFLGCDRSRTVCNDVFGNLANHGGHAYMPDVNPMSGTSIF